MQWVKAFFLRISNDFKQKKLLPLKLLFFVHASTILVLYPYLTIHMRELGINVEETAIMSAVTPVVAIVMPPLAGMLADRIGNFRYLLALFSALGGASALLLLLVPVGRMIVTYPSDLILSATCGIDDGLDISLYKQYPCIENITRSDIKTNIKMQACGFTCAAEQDDMKSILSSIRYRIHVENDPEYSNRNQELTYNLPRSSLEPGLHAHDQNNHKTLKNDEFYRTSIRSSSNTGVFFPASGLYDVNCDKRDDHAVTCMFREELYMNAFTNSQMEMLLKRANSTDTSINYNVEALAGFKTVECQDYFGNVTVYVYPDQKIKEGEVILESVLVLQGCKPTCILTAPRNAFCSNEKDEIELDINLTFWSYLGGRVLVGMIGGTAFAMFEGAVITILREQQGDYGLQRIYATIGGMISSPLSGVLIDYASKGKGYTDFRPAFYLYAALKILSGFLMLSMNLEFKAPAKNIVSDVMTVLRNVELLALLFVCFILGTAWGYIESFLFWLLQDLGGTRSLMGVTITIGGLAGIPLLVLSGPLIERIGHANVLFIGFIFYSIRLMGYSLIYNPWLCLVFEAMEGVTTSLAFTAAVTYAAKLSTTATDTSVQGLLGGLYFGVGKGAGSLVGGFLMKAFGTRPTYQIFSAVTLLTGVGYFMFNRFYLSTLPQVEGNDICKKKPKKNLDLEQAVTNGSQTVLKSDNHIDAELNGNKIVNGTNGTVVPQQNGTIENAASVNEGFEMNENNDNKDSDKTPAVRSNEQSKTADKKNGRVNSDDSK